jgi:pimeloyl-ACP methyl ester carboxylesterase
MKVAANGIQIEVDDQGPVDAEPLLLIMGLGMQLIAWPQELVDLLLRAGFRVIRFDNRDAGLSQGFDEHGVPNLIWAAIKSRLHLPLRNVPYTIDDMAADAVGVLDALGVASAHVCGASMGGMVAQTMAERYPQRVRSLTLLMTSSGARHLPQATRAVQRILMSRPKGHGAEAMVAHFERLFEVIGSPAYRPDAALLRQRLQAMVQRAYRPAGVARQLVAVIAHGDRTPLLARITAPTHVIHGRDDALVPVEAGYDLQRKISGATIDVVDGMGHDLPQPLLPRFAAGIAKVAARRGAT